MKDYERAAASSYLDWIGPSLVRHHDCKIMLEDEWYQSALVPQDLIEHPSCWKVEVIKAHEAAILEEEAQSEDQTWIEKIAKGERIEIESPYKEEIEDRLSWSYAYTSATTHRSKQSVSEIKRQMDTADEASSTQMLRKFTKPLMNRPRFMQEKALSPAEIGTAMHMVMQHIDFLNPIDQDAIFILLDEMVQKELLTEEQRSVINPDLLCDFFQSSLGKRMCAARKLQREIPFSLALPAREAYSDWKGSDEPILVQGIIDCLFEDEDGLVLVDYKTDGITDRFKGGYEEAKPILEKRYKVQIDLYTKAVEQIYKRPVVERFLFFFDGAHLLKLER